MRVKRAARRAARRPEEGGLARLHGHQGAGGRGNHRRCLSRWGTSTSSCARCASTPMQA